MVTFKGDTFVVMRGKHHDGSEGIVLHNPKTKYLLNNPWKVNANAILAFV